MKNLLLARFRRGFTLIEIMIVIVIIGLLAALAIPGFQKIRDNAREKKVLSNLRAIWTAYQQDIIDTPVGFDVDKDWIDKHFPQGLPSAVGEKYDSGTKLDPSVTGIYVTVTAFPENEQIVCYPPVVDGKGNSKSRIAAIGDMPATYRGL